MKQEPTAMIKCPDCAIELGLPGREPTDAERSAFVAHKLHECHIAPGNCTCGWCYKCRERSASRSATTAEITTRAIDELLATTSAFFGLLDACCVGAKLTVEGKPLLASGDAQPSIEAMLTSDTGARFAVARGSEISAVLVSLLRSWKGESQLALRCGNCHAEQGQPHLEDCIASIGGKSCPARLERFRATVGDPKCLPLRPLPCVESEQAPAHCLLCGGVL